MAQPHSPGTLLAGRYRLEERIGTGGMGEVWRATDQELDRTVAVKVMHSALLEDPGFATRFRAEARMMAGISHPGVVSVHDYRDDPTGAVLVMDYVEGEPLSRLLARTGRLPAAHTMEIVAQAADALEAAHSRGVVHRDVKPANLLVRPDGRVVLTDFGIARTQAGTQLTASGAVLGTPSYLAPEQILGEPATPRSDVYALGAVAYECLTGHRPFDRDNPFATAMARIREAPPTLAGDIPPAMVAVVERALATDPAHRWATASELSTACRRAVIAPHAPPGGTPAGAPAGPVPPPPAPMPHGLPGPGPHGLPGPGPHGPATGVDGGLSRGQRVTLAVAGAAAGVVVLVVGLVVALTLVEPDGTGDAAAGNDGGSAGPSAAPPTADPQCAPFADYQGHAGSTVTVLTPLTDVDADRLGDSWRSFTECTGITIDHEGHDSASFESQLQVMLAGGDPPDVALLPRPGMLTELLDLGHLVSAPDAAVAHAPSWIPALRDAGTVDGVQYGVPVRAYVNSLVWYSPSLFTELGYEVPTDWGELITLSDELATEGITPWCEGIESGAATGWPLSHWVADVLLRLHGPATYEQWWRHEIPADDPRVVEALVRTGEIVKNPDYVGDVGQVADTWFADAGLGVADGSCALYRQGTFYASNWPPETRVGEDGDVWAFYLPPMGAGDRPVVGAGELAVGFTDQPETQALLAYLASVDWAAERTAGAGFTPANLEVDPATAADPLDRLTLEILQEPGTDVYYAPPELLPPEVNDLLWSELTEWLDGQDSETTLANVEAGWP